MTHGMLQRLISSKLSILHLQMEDVMMSFSQLLRESLNMFIENLNVPFSSALSLYPTNKSPIYVITDANPNDNAEKETVFHLESYWRAPVRFYNHLPIS